MKDGIRSEKGPRAPESTGPVQRAGVVSDPTPPDDHAEFVELRRAGLRAVRESLARRKKAAEASTRS